LIFSLVKGISSSGPKTSQIQTNVGASGTTNILRSVFQFQPWVLMALRARCVSKGIALNMVQKWLGHAQLTTTAIYADAVGEEEQNIAARMWS
jgi:hypothetical protein